MPREPAKHFLSSYCKRLEHALAGLVLFVVGCSRSSSTLPSASSDAPATAVAPARSAPASPSSSSAAVSAGAIAENVRRVVRVWSDALDRHDVAGLEPLYTDSVRYYGSSALVTRSTVIQLKRAALRDSTFHQQIVGAIELKPETDGSWTALFQKRSGKAGALHDVQAKLVLVPTTGGRMLIGEETDESTQKVTSARQDSACAEAAGKVVHALPEVKAAMGRITEAAKQSDGSARPGGIEPFAMDGDTYVVGEGLHTDESYEGVIWYEVDRTTGELTVTVEGADLVVPPVGLRQVEQACRR